MGAKRIRKSERNRGGYLLARLTIPLAELARQFGVSAPNVTYWIRGTTKPARAKRELALQLHDIPTDAWDEPLDGKPDPAKPAVPPADAKPAVEPEGVRAQAESMAAFVTEQMARIQTDASATPKERMEVVGKAAAVLTTLGKITGEGEVTTKRILASPFFKRIVACIVDATRDHPDVAGKIAVALRRLDGE